MKLKRSITLRAELANLLRRARPSGVLLQDLERMLAHHKSWLGPWWLRRRIRYELREMYLDGYLRTVWDLGVKQTRFMIP